MKIATVALLAAAATSISTGAWAQEAGDPEKGARVFKKCQACHTLEEGGANRIGPNLHGLFSRGVAAVEDFRYSEAMTGKADEIGEWNEETLSAYLKKPRDYVPGTNMSFIGLRKQSDIENIIAYLKQETGAAE